MPKGIPNKKKGKATWEPATLLQLHGMDPNFSYRWERNEPAQLVKARAEGWEVCSSLEAEHEEPGEIDDGSKLTSVTEYREMIVTRMPIEKAQARQEYFEEMSKKQILSLKREVAEDIRKAGGAPVTGSIIID